MTDEREVPQQRVATLQEVVDGHRRHGQRRPGPQQPLHAVTLPTHAARDAWRPRSCPALGRECGTRLRASVMGGPPAAGGGHAGTTELLAAAADEPGADQHEHDAEAEKPEIPRQRRGDVVADVVDPQHVVVDDALDDVERAPAGEEETDVDAPRWCEAALLPRPDRQQRCRPRPAPRSRHGTGRPRACSPPARRWCRTGTDRSPSACGATAGSGATRSRRRTHRARGRGRTQAAHGVPVAPSASAMWPRSTFTGPPPWAAPWACVVTSSRSSSSPARTRSPSHRSVAIHDDRSRPVAASAAHDHGDVAWSSSNSRRIASCCRRTRARRNVAS